MAAEKETSSVKKVEPVPLKAEPKVKDIEEAINDEDMEKKKMDKILDKTR